MSLDKQTVAKVARLARLKMDDAELEERVPQINTIIKWVEQLAEVNTDNVDPLPSPVDIGMKQRKDEVTDGNCQEDVLANAPESLEGFYVVPKVVE